MTQNERKALLEAGASAEILAHVLKDDGQLCDIDLNARLVSIRPHDLARVKRSIGVASGVEKVAPIRAVLRGEYLKSMVVDEQTARSVLEKF